MYLGSYKTNLDNKNRFFLNASLRKQSDGEFILTYIDEDNLILRDRKDWKAKDVIKNCADFFESERIINYIIKHSYTVKLDRQGRILLPKSVIDNFNYKEGIMVVGHYDYINIISLKLYLDEFKKDQELIEEKSLSKKLRKMS